MKTIYFITRAYPGVGRSAGGGGLARKAQVDVLKSFGYEVKIVVPNPNGPTYEQDNIIYIGFKWRKRIYSGLERLGIWIDVFKPWVKSILIYMQDCIKSEDFVFSVTGGSADTFLAGYSLKKQSGCKLVLSYHDPINYTTVNGLVVDDKLMFKKDRFEKMVVEASDLIFTSSKSFMESLQKKYPQISEKIHNSYFGYNVKEDLGDKVFKMPLNIAYTGSFNKHQSPEILYKIADNKLKYHRMFLGYYNHYNPIKPHINDAEFYGTLKHDDFLKFAKEKIDIGFVSLTNDYLSVCFPSKIFEYINLGLPILGALPEGDSKDFINHNKIGRAYHFSDIDGMKQYLNDVTIEELQIQRDNIIKIKDAMYYRNSLNNMFQYIQALN